MTRVRLGNDKPLTIRMIATTTVNSVRLKPALDFKVFHLSLDTKKD